MTTEKKVGESSPSKPSHRSTPFSLSKKRMPESMAACMLTHTYTSVFFRMPLTTPFSPRRPRAVDGNMDVRKRVFEFVSG